MLRIVREAGVEREETEQAQSGFSLGGRLHLVVTVEEEVSQRPAAAVGCNRSVRIIGGAVHVEDADGQGSRAGRCPQGLGVLRYSLGAVPTGRNERDHELV